MSYFVLHTYWLNDEYISKFSSFMVNAIFSFLNKQYIQELTGYAISLIKLYNWNLPFMHSRLIFET